MHYKLILQYDGTRYRGWQVQPNGMTIQEIIEGVLHRILGANIRLKVAGRTDAGVHDTGQVATFRSSRAIAPGNLQHSLNALLPDDISVQSIQEVPNEFDPRFDARSRRYQYRIWNSPHRSAIHARYSWHITYLLDLPAMKSAATLLIGHHDFSSFQGADNIPRTPWRTVVRSSLVHQDGFLFYDVQAQSFVRHMVRNIVGTLVDVGRGALTVRQFKTILEARKRSEAGLKAPPQGLFLLEVLY